ncbi:MAG: hypothetical protein JO169_05915 [Solirubrobacterales bacterium]|nr:hypothetical protein [Solirubrobacterales bacterium]
MALVHHELCFGCGRTNLFGLLLELEASRPGALTGRCFLKQDHQGPERGTAHDGVISAAVSDAMALACGPGAMARELHVELLGTAPVGTFLEIEAELAQGGEPSQPDAGELIQAVATASAEGRLVARARGVYGLPEPG